MLPRGRGAFRQDDMSDTITGSLIADRYRVTGFLRAGRMGDIYVARRTGDERKVAVKVLDPGLFGNEEAVKRFEREAKITLAIDHPCSTRVLDYGRAVQGPYLVMEYVEGELLSDVIDEHGALAPERAARIAAQIALALDAAHAKGVIHRDLAPSNVLIAQQDGKKDLVKVTDFGLALLTHEDDGAESTNLSAVGVRIGTPAYMAPEYIEEYELDHRADIYGLGVMLFEMLTGAAPFTGRPYKIMDAHVNTPMPKPSSKKTGVPAWLDDLVLAMTHKAPKDRVQTAREVASALEKGLGAAVELLEYQAPTSRPAPQREERPPTPPPAAIDPILAHFLQRNAARVTRSKAPAPNKARLFVVTRVAPTSIAGQAGVKVGWWCHLPVEKERPGLLDPALHHKVLDRRVYHFYTADLAERIEVVAGGIPLGLELVRSPENVVGAYDPLAPDASALLDLWVQSRWDDLEKLAYRTMMQQKGASALLATGLFARFLGSDKPKLLDHPATLFLGAALYEKGNLADGSRWITDFKTKYAQKWPAVYDAVAHFYAARDKATSDKAAAADLLHLSLQLHPFEAARALLEKLSGAPPVVAHWVGRTWTDYSMDSADGKGAARLSDTLEQMDSSQLLTVVLMGGFRGNDDYDEFMYRWANLAAFFQEFLFAIHVVTTKTEPEADRPDHYRGEGVVRSSGMPFLVLYDYRAFVQRAFKPGRVPTIYLLDRNGTCVHEGLLTDCDLWDALTLAGRLRAERFQQAPR
jgi:serine/threonine protein kinase